MGNYYAMAISIEKVGIDRGSFKSAAIVHSTLVRSDRKLCSLLKSGYGVEHVAIRSILPGKRKYEFRTSPMDKECKACKA